MVTLVRSGYIRLGLFKPGKAILAGLEHFTPYLSRLGQVRPGYVWFGPVKPC